MSLLLQSSLKRGGLTFELIVELRETLPKYCKVDTQRSLFSEVDNTLLLKSINKILKKKRKSGDKDKSYYKPDISLKHRKRFLDVEIKTQTFSKAGVEDLLLALMLPEKINKRYKDNLSYQSQFILVILCDSKEDLVPNKDKILHKLTELELELNAKIEYDSFAIGKLLVFAS